MLQHVARVGAWLGARVIVTGRRMEMGATAVIYFFFEVGLGGSTSTAAATATATAMYATWKIHYHEVNFY